MKRILCVNPPFYRLLGSHYNGLCLGLAYIASTLNHHGHDAWVYNADFDSTPSYKTLYDIFRDFHGFDETPTRECIERIVEFNPDWVGYSCYTAVIPVLQQITREVRKRIPGVKQVIGGPHATLDASTHLLLPDSDYVVQGEGENALLSLVMDGSYSSRVVRKPRITNLDELPFPERAKFWNDSGRDVCYVSTARGCPWRCAYCASPEIWPRVYSRSPTNVIAEIATLPFDATAHSSVDGAKLRIEDNSCLYIIDDTFTFNEKRALTILDGMNGIPWKCEARADTITPRLAKAMARTNCQRVKMGVESGSERILKFINKGETKEDMRRAVQLLHSEGVLVTVYLMAGFPGETDDDLRHTIAFARELQADYYSISMVAPYYGTRLYRDAVRDGLPVANAPWEVFFHHNASLLLNPTLSRELIEELWGLCDIKRYV